HPAAQTCQAAGARGGKVPGLTRHDTMRRTWTAASSRLQTGADAERQDQCCGNQGISARRSAIMRGDANRPSRRRIPMTATTPTTAPVIVAAGDQRRRIFAIVAASSGNLVEWFDFYVYAFMAVYFAPAFFPGADPTVQLLDAAGIFAAGFLVRPIGGWLFGRIADRHGRRLALVASVLLMGGGSLVIALLPTYASIGVLAPALLLVARLLQGLSVGGEYGTTATYMSEVAIRGQRGLLASFQYTTLIGGQLLAVLVLVTLQRVFDDAELRAWAWRIPFGIGAITALLALWLRSGLHETAPRIDRGNREAGSLGVLLREHKAAFLTVLGYTAGGSLAF